MRGHEKNLMLEAGPSKCSFPYRAQVVRLLYGFEKWLEQVSGTALLTQRLHHLLLFDGIGKNGPMERGAAFMKYINASSVLPEELLREVSQYAGGELLYIPVSREKRAWGEQSGSREFFRERNQVIARLFSEGKRAEELADLFGLSVESIRKIVRKK